MDSHGDERSSADEGSLALSALKEEEEGVKCQRPIGSRHLLTPWRVTSPVSAPRSWATLGD